jgi:hypothetical protein
MKELFELLEEPLREGLYVTIYYQNGNLWADLNTQAKSQCILECREDGIYAHRRYDRVDKVKNYEHLLQLIVECGHGRSFFSADWWNILEKHNLKPDVGSL